MEFDGWDSFKEVKRPEYYIGVDTRNKNVSAYCLTMKVDNEITVVLSNKRFDKDEFEKEVKNLAKYFNAHIVREE